MRFLFIIFIFIFIFIFINKYCSDTLNLTGGFNELLNFNIFTNYKSDFNTFYTPSDDNTPSDYNKKYTTTQTSNIEPHNLLTCIKQCLDNIKCVAFNYNINQKICQYKYNTFNNNENNNNLIYDSNFITYIKKKNFF